MGTFVDRDKTMLEWEMCSYAEVDHIYLLTVVGN